MRLLYALAFGGITGAVIAESITSLAGPWGTLVWLPLNVAVAVLLATTVVDRPSTATPSRPSPPTAGTGGGR